MMPVGPAASLAQGRAMAPANRQQVYPDAVRTAEWEKRR